MKKIRVAFIFESSNIFLSGHHFDNTYYHFFINALKRNERLEMTYFPTKEIFDAWTPFLPGFEQQSAFTF